MKFMYTYLYVVELPYLVIFIQNISRLLCLKQKEGTHSAAYTSAALR